MYERTDIQIRSSQYFAPYSGCEVTISPAVDKQKERRRKKEETTG